MIKVIFVLERRREWKIRFQVGSKDFIVCVCFFGYFQATILVVSMILACASAMPQYDGGFGGVTSSQPSDGSYPIGGGIGSSGNSYPVGGGIGSSGSSYPVGGGFGSSGNSYPVGGGFGSSDTSYPIGGGIGSSTGYDRKWKR